MSEAGKHINYSAAAIEKYWKGELSPVEMHDMEKAALEDPFLADAMEGYEGRNLELGTGSSKSTIQADIAALESRLAARVAEKKVVVAGSFNWWKVAAAVIVLIGGVWVYTSLNNKTKEISIAKKEAVKNIQPVPVTDSARAFLNTTDSIQLKDVAVAEKKRPAAAVKTAPFSPKEKEYKADLKHDSLINPGLASAKEEVAKNEDRKEPKSSEIAIAKPEIKRNADKSVSAEINGRVKGVATDDGNKNDLLERRANNYIGNTFNGKVVDQLNQPVANAMIQIPNLNVATQTDKKGFFSFKAPDTALSVSVASVGYETQNLKLQNRYNFSNQIKLKPATASLDEVVVTGYGTQKKKAFSKTKDVTIKILDAEPAVSWDEYSAYLEKNKKIPDEAKDIHGDVVVTFTIDSKGVVKNFNIEKTLNEQLDEEAIRLVKEGPSWHVLKGKKAKASVIVKF
jgi:CarboxypepD_reg-like domain/Gram-negative bacterial TonB protein C-terminal